MGAVAGRGPPTSGRSAAENIVRTSASGIDVDQLEALSGHEVRSEYRQPDEPGFEPLGVAVLVTPATFNTINKWALGINDNLALGLLNEALGRDVPITIEPYANEALTHHGRYRDSLEFLTKGGVNVVPLDEERLG